MTGSLKKRKRSSFPAGPTPPSFDIDHVARLAGRDLAAVCGPRGGHYLVVIVDAGGAISVASDAVAPDVPKLLEAARAHVEHALKERDGKVKPS